MVHVFDTDTLRWKINPTLSKLLKPNSRSRSSLPQQQQQQQQQGCKGTLCLPRTPMMTCLVCRVASCRGSEGVWHVVVLEDMDGSHHAPSRCRLLTVDTASPIMRKLVVPPLDLGEPSSAAHTRPVHSLGIARITSVHQSALCMPMHRKLSHGPWQQSPKCMRPLSIDDGLGTRRSLCARDGCDALL